MPPPIDLTCAPAACSDGTSVGGDVRRRDLELDLVLCPSGHNVHHCVVRRVRHLERRPATDRDGVEADERTVGIERAGDVLGPGDQLPLSDTVLLPVNVLSALTMTLSPCFHTLSHWVIVSFGWRTVNVAVVMALVTGTSQRSTRASGVSDGGHGCGRRDGEREDDLLHFFPMFAAISCDRADGEPGRRDA